MKSKLNHATVRLIAQSDLFDEWCRFEGWSEYSELTYVRCGWTEVEMIDLDSLLERFLRNWDSEMVLAVEIGNACGMSVREVWDLYQDEVEAFEIIKGHCRLAAA